jgi:hypothetical protein
LTAILEDPASQPPLPLYGPAPGPAPAPLPALVPTGAVRRPRPDRGTGHRPLAVPPLPAASEVPPRLAVPAFPPIRAGCRPWHRFRLTAGGSYGAPLAAAVLAATAVLAPGPLHTAPASVPVPMSTLLPCVAHGSGTNR